jgi:hypothetical protein
MSTMCVRTELGNSLLADKIGVNHQIREGHLSVQSKIRQIYLPNSLWTTIA